MWILIAAGVLGLVLLIAVTVPVLSRLSGLRRAVVKLQRRQQEAQALQAGAETLQTTLAGLQQRAETMQERLAIVKAGHDDTGKHAFVNRLSR
jgi:polyphosphate kinase 2 (PPK2 family)